MTTAWLTQEADYKYKNRAQDLSRAGTTGKKIHEEDSHLKRDCQSLFTPMRLEGKWHCSVTTRPLQSASASSSTIVLVTDSMVTSASCTTYTKSNPHLKSKALHV